MSQETVKKTNEVRIKALELAISTIEAHKNSVLPEGYAVHIIRAADAIADYIAEGKLP
ncbi:hypothetical protein AGMMS49944_20740 [Spirochaetia bacterium]|nr:hypothetical protein AGMMS49944_20740 [Spirochaetia bacterium]